MKLFNHSPLVGSVLTQDNWSQSRKIAFRFFFIFFLLFILPYPLNQNPLAQMAWWNQLLGNYYQATNWLVTKAALIFAGIEEFPAGSPGSGDRTYNWVQNILYLSIAGVGCIIWSVLDRKRKSYAKLWKWFYILMVYNLAYWLFVYGLMKVWPTQFSSPGIARLLETFGESSPMRIMWTFMGASEAYTSFSGWSEAIAAILLLFRRTRTLGALAAAGVMFNVFMMNMTYDVPVKLFSFRLIMAGLWIAAADHKRLLGFFLFNKAIPAQQYKSMFITPWKNYVLLGIMMLFMGWHVYSNIDYYSQFRKDYGPDRESHALYGIHDVDTFVLNGDTIPPLLTDTIRWKKAFMDLPGYSGQLFGIKMMNDNVRYLRAEMDSAEQVLTLKPFRDTVTVYHLNYTFEGENLSLEGLFEGDTLQVNTVYFNPDDFILRSRGFRWINEVPYNRRVPYRQ